ALVAENDDWRNHPRVAHWDAIGQRADRVVHHPAYAAAGDLVYGTGMVARMARPGGLTEGMAFYYLSNHVGEAGHHCPLICNYETARVLSACDDLPERDALVARLLAPSFAE